MHSIVCNVLSMPRTNKQTPYKRCKQIETLFSLSQFHAIEKQHAKPMSISVLTNHISLPRSLALPLLPFSLCSTREAKKTSSISISLVGRNFKWLKQAKISHVLNNLMASMWFITKSLSKRWMAPKFEFNRKSVRSYVLFQSTGTVYRAINVFYPINNYWKLPNFTLALIFIRIVFGCLWKLCVPIWYYQVHIFHTNRSEINWLTCHHVQFNQKICAIERQSTQNIGYHRLKAESHFDQTAYFALIAFSSNELIIYLPNWMQSYEICKQWQNAICYHRIPQVQ